MIGFSGQVVWFWDFGLLTESIMIVQKCGF